MTERVTKYSRMTELPEHVERRLLEFNILQLCALVSEKSGPRWIGASDPYGPIQEIARRWKLEELLKRLGEIGPEDPIMTYARVMTAAGGNPSAGRAPSPPLDMEEAINRKFEASKYKWGDKMRREASPDDKVSTTLATCTNVDDLRKVANDQKLQINWLVVNNLANFGLKRMYVGNQWRTKIRRESKA